MSEPYISQIEIFGFGFAPKNWANCAGQVMPISQNQALFSLLGTTYGGNGVQTFALPDLRGRVPISMGQGPGLPAYSEGQVGGEETHVLQTGEMPLHTHLIMADAATTTGIVNTPASNLSLGQSSGQPPSGSAFAVNIYNTAAPGQGSALAPGAIGTTGNNQAHENRMPYLGINVCICLFGLFPSRD
jgi:microcystin-dependent protein